MPNWCEGNIRLRGKRGDIEAFLREELTYGISDNPVNVKHEFDDCFMFYGMSDDPDKKSWCELYVKDTRRNFIDAPFEIELYDEDMCVRIDGFRAAWDIDPEPYIEKSKKYHLDIKLVGVEMGQQFERVIEIIDGEVKRFECHDYKDWDWEAMFPNMGG